MGTRGQNLLRLVLRPGTIFYQQDRRLSSPEPHYFIVLNYAPLSDEHLVLCVTSSQLEKVRKRCARQPETAVTITPDACAVFPRDSIVNCNEVFPKDWRVLAAHMETKEAEVRGELPLALLDALRAGVLASCTVPDAIKTVLRGS